MATKGAKKAAARKAEEDFQTRTVMAMATEMAEAQETVSRLCVQFAALAKSKGVKFE